MAVDWREIFIHYTIRVGENEGVTFLYEHDWPAEEWAAIQEVEREIETGTEYQSDSATIYHSDRIGQRMKLEP
jgi:hypothetical protein